MLLKRIFWMGSHKVLIPTELKALQDMGYETFYPRYLGKERDQSAVYEWACPPTSLPEDVVRKLSSFNFFWNAITDEIADLLNAHFDCVIVTINGDWLLSFLTAFKGKIIYRTFGEPYSLSSHLKSNGARELIEAHPDFWFMPHCIENAVREEWWLRRREKIVPYCLTDDVLELANSWEVDAEHSGEIGLTCPNITNPYYNQHFRYLKSNFEERFYRYYGVQVDRFSDPNVVGTLDRHAQLAKFVKLSGFLYTYREPNVCYLPPVEMITIGGPVLYLPGSLLDRYLGQNNAGRVEDEDTARGAASRLVGGDAAFAKEIIDSQRGVARRYDSSYTLPMFRQAMGEILPLTAAEPSKVDAVARVAVELAEDDRPVLLLGHFRSAYLYSNGEYVSVHGIPRVMRRVVQALTEAGKRVTITAEPDAANETWGFYASQTSRPDLIDVVDHSHALHAQRQAGPADVQSYFHAVRARKMHWIDGAFPASVVLAGALVRLFGRPAPTEQVEETAFDDFSYVIVPHYYLFPEAVRLTGAKLLLYLPDYMPHFFKGRGWFPEDESYMATGRSLARLSKYILTNSEFTKDYLPDSDLEVDASKIIAFPLPHLASQTRGTVDPVIKEQLEGTEYIFYPTQAHPNKRLDLLVKAWLELRETSGCDYKLVLTTGALHPELERITRKAGACDDVVLLPGVSDTALAWLYRNACSLAFTSEMEGNFPTQIIEALELDCPIVTFEHPTIQAELGAGADFLESAPFADLGRFVERIRYVRRFRSRVLEKQRKLLGEVRHHLSYEVFRSNVLQLDKNMRSAPCGGRAAVSCAGAQR